MKDKIRKRTGQLLILVSVLLLAVYISSEILWYKTFDGTQIIQNTVLMGLPMIFGTFLLVCGIRDVEKKKQVVAAVETIIFGVYIVLLLCILLFADRGNIFYAGMGIKQYLSMNTNLIPFYGIVDYVNNHINDILSTRILLANLIEDFMLFLPMGILLPSLFKRTESWMQFIKYIILILCGIELMQLVIKTGTFDIDEFMVNMSGACVGVMIVKTKLVQHCKSKFMSL